MIKLENIHTDADLEKVLRRLADRLVPDYSATKKDIGGVYDVVCHIPRKKEVVEEFLQNEESV